MKYAATFLKLIYGGHTQQRPAWQDAAIKKLQNMNRGYHLGRFINCLEVSMHAYKGILATQGDFFPNVTPLPNVPPFIPGYMSKLYQRMEHLDDTKKATHVWNLSYSYSKLMDYVLLKKLPLYTHFIILADFKKMGGGHALSGMLIPSEKAPGYTIFLYDAQGFLPDEWLHAEQFDSFYLIDSFFIFDSIKTQKSVKQFIELCMRQTEPAPLSEEHDTPTLKSTEEIIAEVKSLRMRLGEFIKLEHFRLSAKHLLKVNDHLEKKIAEYCHLLDELNTAVPDPQLYLATAQLFIKTEQLVKTHFYSYNWFNPQSLEYFKIFFGADMKHKPFDGKFSSATFSHYLALFIVQEIIRIGKENNAATTNKISSLVNQLARIFPITGDAELADVFHETYKICTSTRTLTWFNPESKELFRVNLEPLQVALTDSLKALTPP